MNWKQIVILHGKKGEIRKRLSENRRKLRAVNIRVGRDEKYLEEIAEVTEIWRGHPLAIHEWGKGHLDLYGCGEDLPRYAKIHPNAHNGGKTWGLTIYTGYGYGKDEFLGAYWPNKSALIKLAKDWIVNKKYPGAKFKEDERG